MDDVSSIRALGFDLDNTLYVQTPEMQGLITAYLAERASEELGITIDRAREEYAFRYASLQSGRRALETMGVADGAALVQEALENADVASVLQPDSRLAGMLARVHRTWPLFLITSGHQAQADRKLELLCGVDAVHHFDMRIYGESSLRREDGSAFRAVAGRFDCAIDELLFVGDRVNVDILPLARLGGQTAIVNASSEHATYNLKDIYALEEVLSS